VPKFHSNATSLRYGIPRNAPYSFKILFHFGLELVDRMEYWADQKAWVLWDKKPLMVKLSM
jgi:hypothetical protein